MAKRVLENEKSSRVDTHVERVLADDHGHVRASPLTLKTGALSEIAVKGFSRIGMCLIRRHSSVRAR